LRWAKALKNIAENMSVYIDDDQLLVGRSGCEGRYGILYPELDGDFLDLAVKELSSRDVSPFIIDPADADTIINEIAPTGRERPTMKIWPRPSRKRHCP
jgi:hypothetical protein